MLWACWVEACCGYCRHCCLVWICTAGTCRPGRRCSPVARCCQDLCSLAHCSAQRNPNGIARLWPPCCPTSTGLAAAGCQCVAGIRQPGGDAVHAALCGPGQAHPQPGGCGHWVFCPTTLVGGIVSRVSVVLGGLRTPLRCVKPSRLRLIGCSHAWAPSMLGSASLHAPPMCCACPPARHGGARPVVRVGCNCSRHRFEATCPALLPPLPAWGPIRRR